MTKLALAALLIGLVACGKDDPPPIVVPDSPPPPCDPLAQTGCMANEKCATRILQEGSATQREITDVACVPDGTVEIGGACSYSAVAEGGHSNCKAGGECVTGICKQVCDHQGGAPRCDDNHACGTYEGLLSRNDDTIAGVCDPKCDPLTQKLVIGQNQDACGSVDPAKADSGCFTFDQIDFTCARIPGDDPNTPVMEGAQHLTDRMRALAPAGTQGVAYVNGCAAGYIPRYIEQTGSMAVICMGLCAPTRVDNQNTTNTKGDPAVPVKLHNKATAEPGDGLCLPGAKGSEGEMNCQHLWFWNFDSNFMYRPGPYNNNTGLCWGYTHYTIDHDMNPATPRIGWPRCEDLPPMGMTPSPEYGHAEEWGCAPRGTLQLTGVKLRPAVQEFMRDVHLGLGAGPATRHLLRLRQ